MKHNKLNNLKQSWSLFHLYEIHRFMYFTNVNRWNNFSSKQDCLSSVSLWKNEDSPCNLQWRLVEDQVYKEYPYCKRLAISSRLIMILSHLNTHDTTHSCPQNVVREETLKWNKKKYIQKCKILSALDFFSVISSTQYSHIHNFFSTTLHIPL